MVAAIELSTRMDVGERREDGAYPEGALLGMAVALWQAAGRPGRGEQAGASPGVLPVVMAQPPELRAALAPLSMEHLQSLREGGATPLVREVVTLALRVVRDDPETTWDDVSTLLVGHSFTGGLRRFEALLDGYEPGPGPHPWEAEVFDLVHGEGSDVRRAELDPLSHAAGAALFAFLEAALDLVTAPPHRP